MGTVQNGVTKGSNNEGHLTACIIIPHQKSLVENNSMTKQLHYAQNFDSANYKNNLTLVTDKTEIYMYTTCTSL